MWLDTKTKLTKMSFLETYNLTLKYFMSTSYMKKEKIIIEDIPKTTARLIVNEGIVNCVNTVAKQWLSIKVKQSCLRTYLYPGYPWARNVSHEKEDIFPAKLLALPDNYSKNLSRILYRWIKIFLI